MSVPVVPWFTARPGVYISFVSIRLDGRGGDYNGTEYAGLFARNEADWVYVYAGSEFDVRIYSRLHLVCGIYASPFLGGVDVSEVLLYGGEYESKARGGVSVYAEAGLRYRLTVRLEARGVFFLRDTLAAAEGRFKLSGVYAGYGASGGAADVSARLRVWGGYAGLAYRL